VSAPTPEPPPQPSLAPGAASAAAADADLDAALGKPKGVPVVVTIAAILGSLGIGTALGALVLGGGGDPSTAVATASVSAPPPPASSAPPPPPPPPPKSLAEKAIEGDLAAFKQLEGKATRERTSEETLALVQGELVQKQKALAELARKTELVAAFGKSEDTQKTFTEAVKDPRQSTASLEILAKMSGPMGPDYLYKVYRLPQRHPLTEKLALDLLLSKDIYGKASDALKIVLDMDQAIQAESKDCPGMIKLLVRAQADADTRAFRPIASLNSKRGCGDNKLQDCWECLRDGEGKDAMADAIKLARKNKAPF
jgi:hypothetical protein